MQINPLIDDQRFDALQNGKLALTGADKI